MTPLEKHIKESPYGKLSEADKLELAMKGLWPIVKVPREVLEEVFPSKKSTPCENVLGDDAG
jgi:hypothetical protein